jgi:flagellar protein FlgJ
VKITPNPPPPPINDAPSAQDVKLKKLSKQFEAIFVNQLVSAMRKTVTHDGFVPESQAERVYKSMLDSEYSGKISDSNQLGLSNMVYEQLKRIK